MAYAFEHRDETNQYVKRYAQEMEPSVIRRHIDLYVNDFTLNMGEEGENAVEALFSMARDRGLMPESRHPLFAC